MQDSETFYTKMNATKRDWNIGDLTDEMMLEFAGLEPTPVDVSEAVTRAAKKHEQNKAYRATETGRDRLRAALRKFSKSAKGRAGAARRRAAKKGATS